MRGLRMVLGLGGAGLLALTLVLPALPRAIAASAPVKTLLPDASGMFPSPFDPQDLYKWRYTIEPGTSVAPKRASTIRKIGFGRTEYVQVFETASGTYSTDGLASPNIEYPGILKRRVPTDTGLRLWSDGRWQLVRPVAAGSFVSITHINGGQLIVTNDGICVVTSSSVRC